MNRTAHRLRWGWIYAWLALLPLGEWSCRRAAVVAPPAPPPATRPAPQQVTADSTPPEPRPTTSYIDLVRTDNPQVPATQPLGIPVDLRDAAHLLFPEPIYVDPKGDDWITRDDAPLMDRNFWKTVGDQQVHLVRQRVLFVAWYPVDTQFTPLIIVADESSPTVAPIAIGRNATTTLPARNYLWDRAIATLTTMYVPTDAGVSAFSLTTLAETHHDLLSADDIAAVAAGRKTFAAPRMVFDSSAKLIAWIPCEDPAHPGTRPARFSDDAWTDLTGSDWSDRLLYLIPLGDGTVLELIHNPDDTVAFALTAPLDNVAVDQHHIMDEVDKLASLDPTERDAASEDLTALGPAAWSILEKVADQQPPEAQARIRVILQNRTAPTLAGLTSPSGQLKVMASNHAGGIVLYAPSLVQTTTDGPPRVIAPAWLQIIPGRPVLLIPQNQIGALDVDRDRFALCGNDLLIVDPVLGLRWFDGSQYQNLTRKSETDFRQIIDRDSAGRWFLARPPTGLPTLPPALPPASAPSTNIAVADTSAPSTQPADRVMTLVIDPTISDPTPRLPIWLIDTAPASGWDSDNWPAIKRGGAWRLKESDWEPIDEAKTPFLTQMPAATAPAESAATTTNPTTAPSILAATAPTTAQITTAQPATHPPTTSPLATTAPTTIPADLAARQPILIADDGTRYYDGLTSLIVLRPDFTRIVWPLPPSAIGDGPATLIQSRDGRLFLFNANGRVVRLHATPESAQPFALDAVFTRGIPDTDHPTRIWLDPAGRIAESDGTLLWVMFPDGRIPPAIREKMPAAADQDDDQ